MEKIFGYKRWYEVKNENFENVMRKIRVKREYITNEYIIKKDEHEEKNIINNLEFIDEFKKNKGKKGKKIDVKFNIGNVLFKLSVHNNKEIKFKDASDVVKKIEILEQSRKLSDFSQRNNQSNKNGNKITRNKICDELIRQIEQKKINENSDKLFIDGIKIKLEKNEDFNKNQDCYAIKWKLLSSEDQNLKKLLYKECQNINTSLYRLLFLATTASFFGKRYYLKRLEEEYLKEEKILNKILESLKKIKEIVNTKELVAYVKFLFNITGEKNISENKIHFSEKVLNYIEFDLVIDKKDIVEFLIGELKKYEIIKRVDEKFGKNELQNQDEINSRLIKTYISLDRHEKYKEKQKDEIIKKIIKKIKNNRLESEIKEILKIFEINKLKEKIIKEISTKGIDTNLFFIFKKHYESIVHIVGEDNIKNMLLEDKELYKITYRYLKGRIEKILQNRERIFSNKLSVELIFAEEELKKKIVKRVEQYCLEYILYLGKIEQLFDGEIKRINTNEFIKEHANEELALELITLFATTNISLNEFLAYEDEITDYFGKDFSETQKSIKVKVDKIAIKYELLRRLDFISENTMELTDKFKDFLGEAFSIRNKILHGKYNNLLSGNNDQKLKSEYQRVNKTIELLRVDDKEISNSLNLDIIFERKENIVEKINKLIIGNSREAKYFPSFSKLVSEIKSVIRENDKNNIFSDKKLEDIILNSAIYVNKILYLKEISNLESSFMKYLKDKILENKSIEQLYKSAQVSASKGNKKAIKNYQEKITEEYLIYLKNSDEFKEILDFSNFKYNLEEVKIKINTKKEINNKFVLESIKNTVEPKNDFEYVIAVFGLLNDNVFINKIRNRFFSTDSWLNYRQNENIVKILDEIIGCNILKDELSISKDDVGLVHINQWIKKIPLEKEKHKELLDKLKDEENNYNKELFGKILLEKEDRVNLINEEFSIKEIVNRDLYTYLPIPNSEGKRFSERYVFKFKNNNLKIDENRKIPTAKGKIKKFAEYIEIHLNNQRAILIKKLVENQKKFPIEVIEKYEYLMKEFEKMVKFKNIFYQEEKKLDKTIEKVFIYKKNIFSNISKHNFETIYKEFLKDELKIVDTSIFELEKNIVDRDIPKKILKVDKVLESINSKFKSYSGNYKKNVIQQVKYNKFRSILKDFQYENYEKFLENYNEISSYKRNRDIVEFNILNKINHYLIEINWKLAIQMARLERDLHYIILGMNKLNIIELKRKNNGELEINKGKTKAYPDDKTENLTLNNYNETGHYKFNRLDDYKTLKILCGKLGINLSKDGELQKVGKSNIRNYISHFHIVRSSFLDEESLAEKIDQVSNLLSYRTKYNNTTYNSVFEVFKKDVNLEYDELKKKIVLTQLGKDKAVTVGNNVSIINLDKLISPKKISVLELKHYNGDKIIELIKKILLYKK